MTLILDAGDFADFKRVELVGTRGKLASDHLTLAHYDAITIGNNETFQGIEMLQDMGKGSSVPFLSCNLKHIKHIHPYHIVEKQNVQFLIIGTSPNIPIFNELLGYTYRDYIKAIKTIINQVPHDICILLNHIGTNNDKVLAKSIKGIDFIISSHDHKLYPKAKIINKVINHSAGEYGKNLGFLEFSYDKINGNVKLLDSKVIPITYVKEDKEVLSLIKQNKKEAIRNLSGSLYPISKTLYHDYIEECPIGNLLADAFRDLLHCDIGIINSGIVSGGIKKGHVSELKLVEIAPSPLNATSFYIKGKDIKEALEHTLDPSICLNSGKGPGFRGIAIGRLHVSGLKVYTKNRQIINIKIDEHDLENETYYKVGSCDYLQRNQIYLALSNNIKPEFHVEYVKDVLRIYLEKEDFIQNAFYERFIES